MFFVSNMLDIVSDWQEKVVNAVNKLLIPILIIGCSVGMIWAIVIGIKMMKADDKNAREENKQKLINIAISIVAIAVLIGLFAALGEYLKDKSSADFKTALEKTNVVGNNLLNTVNLVKQCARAIIFKC